MRRGDFLSAKFYKELGYPCDEDYYEKALNIIRNKIKKLEKKNRRLQWSIARKHENNKKGECYCKTSNIIKKEKELLKLNYRLSNIHYSYLHEMISEIVKRKLSFICIESWNIKNDEEKFECSFL